MIRRLMGALTGRSPGSTGTGSGGSGPGSGSGASGPVDLWLVVGLGNPGREYAGHRHNVGYMVVDLIAERLGARWRRHGRAVAETAEGRWGYPGPRLVLAKPLTYMNLSGGPTVALSRFYKIPADRILTVHDEIDLPWGTLRARFDGGEGGHNGVRSLVRSLSTRDFYRLRFGVGRPPGRRDPADWVLSDFSAAERKDLDFLLDRAADFAEAIITKGLEPAQNVYHAA